MSSSSYWRLRAAPIIAKTLTDTTGLTPKERRAHLRQAYPFGSRKQWPYRAWLDEIRAQWPGGRRVPAEPDDLELLP